MTVGADRESRRIARTCFGKPVVLEAGAGTGKTTALVARVVAWLVDAGFDRALAVTRDAGNAELAHASAAARALQGLLAITFTEAAAADMDAKIRAALALVELGQAPIGMEDHAFASPPEERRRRAHALRTALERPVAQTIHAWCQSLLAQHPLEAGLHPRFTVDARGREVEEVVRRVVTDDLRERLGDEPDDDWLVLAQRNVGPGAVERAVVALIVDGRRAEDFATDPFPREELVRIEDEMWSTVRAFLAACRGPLAASCKRTPMSGEVVTALDAALDLASRPVTEAAALSRRAQDVKNVLNTRIRERVKEWSESKFGKRMQADVGDDVRTIADRAAELSKTLARYVRLDPQLESAARRTLARLLGASRKALVQSGIETFGDLLRDARDLLERDRDLRARLRSRLDQVLVDEFQDTDPLQCDLVRWIALGADPGEKPGLLIVGDPKQSIYGWRRADLKAYDEFVAEVLRAGGISARLTLNFRSGQALLDHVQHVVRPHMTHVPGVQPEFVPLIAHRTDAASRVEWWNARQPAPDGDDQKARTSAAEGTRLEAQFVAAELRASRARGLEWSDMAVLLRTTTALESLLDALRDAGIPFDVAGDKSYYRRREILDAAALFTCIVDPGDHVALLAYLRSPWVGLPDALLLPLWNESFGTLAGELDSDRPETLQLARAAVKRALKVMPRDVPRMESIAGFEHALDHGLETLAALRASWRRDPVDAFLEQARLLLLCEAGAAARFQGAHRLANLERFFGDVALELETNGGDAQALLRYVRTAISSAPEMADARPRGAASSAVPILTIHKSKGLDFREVFVLGLQRAGRGRGAARLETRWDRAGHVLFGAPTPGWFAVEDRAQERDRAERVRLLYVAMTRAKERLVLSGIWSDPPKEGPRVNFTSLLHLLEAGLPSEARSHFDTWSKGAPDACEIDGVQYRVTAEIKALEHALSASGSVDVARAQADSSRLAAERPAAKARADLRLVVPMSSSRPTDDEEWLDDDAGPRAPRTAPAGAPAIAGTAIHRALETMSLEGDLEAAMRAARATLPARVAQIALESPDGGASVSSEALALAETVFDAFAGGAAFAHMRHVSPNVIARELPVLTQLEPDTGLEQVASGAIDLVYRDANGHWVVVDYKTGAEPAAEAPASHRAQVSVYRHALRDALALDHLPRGELWYLASSRVVTVE